MYGKRSYKKILKRVQDDRSNGNLDPWSSQGGQKKENTEENHESQFYYDERKASVGASLFLPRILFLLSAKEKR
ncbi:hypothetical protein CSB09_00415, partial [Candidatus Gracilibacteria bacterium]